MRGWAGWIFPLLVGLLALRPVEALADVDLEWRPMQRTVLVGAFVAVGLYAVSDSAVDQPIKNLQAIFLWDPTLLELVPPSIAPCPAEPCDPNTYMWLDSGFPPSTIGSELNTTFDDGDAFFLALSRLLPEPPAFATPDGLLVTIIVFRTLTAGVANIAMEPGTDPVVRTRVRDDSNADVTGVLGPPAQVMIGSCDPPTVTAGGSRYLAITPAPGDLPVALRVAGDELDAAVDCVSLFVQDDGRFGLEPFFQDADQWLTVSVGNREIIPSTSYTVDAICQQAKNVSISSNTVDVSTWVWGDVNHNGSADVLDIVLVLDGSLGRIGEGLLLENLDLAPCTPDFVIDELDILAVQSAVSGSVFPCFAPCRADIDFALFRAFVDCLDDPAVPVDTSCMPFDTHGDDSLDMLDVAQYWIDPP